MRNRPGRAERQTFRREHSPVTAAKLALTQLQGGRYSEAQATLQRALVAGKGTSGKSGQ